MKKLTLTLCLIFIASLLFAGVSQSVGLGVGLDAYSLDEKEGGSLTKFSTNAFGISITGMTTFDKVEHLVVYENIDLGFPNTFKSEGASISVDSSTLWGLTVGAGYTSAIKKSPVSYSIGAGFGWQNLSYTVSSYKSSRSCLTLSVFGNVRYDIKDGWFADLTLLDSMGFSTMAKDSMGSSTYGAFMNNSIVKIGGGYSFSF